jgi:hypothetical protein
MHQRQSGPLGVGGLSLALFIASWKSRIDQLPTQLVSEQLDSIAPDTFRVLSAAIRVFLSQKLAQLQISRRCEFEALRRQRLGGRMVERWSPRPPPALSAPFPHPLPSHSTASSHLNEPPSWVDPLFSKAALSALNQLFRLSVVRLKRSVAVSFSGAPSRLRPFAASLSLEMEHKLRSLVSEQLWTTATQNCKLQNFKSQTNGNSSHSRVGVRNLSPATARSGRSQIFIRRQTVTGRGE